MLQGFQRQGGPQNPRSPITSHILHSLLQTLNASVHPSYDKALFSAMFVLAFHCFLRVGELTSRNASQACSLCLADLSFTTLNADTPALQLTLRDFKGNINHSPFHIVVPSYPTSPWCPVSVLRHYLSLRGNISGPLFCRADMHAITRAEFTTVLNNLSTSLGLANIKPHSFRIGAATSACANGVHDDVIQRLGRWKSDAYKRYVRMPSFKSTI